MNSSTKSKLRQMAHQTVSPNEAIVAAKMLGEEPSGEVLWAQHQDWLAHHEVTFCPGCHHSEFSHVAGICYACGGCGWSILGEGNAWDLPAGWHKWQ